MQFSVDHKVSRRPYLQRSGVSKSHHRYLVNPTPRCQIHTIHSPYSWGYYPTPTHTAQPPSKYSTTSLVSLLPLLRFPLPNLSGKIATHGINLKSRARFSIERIYTPLCSTITRIFGRTPCWYRNPGFLTSSRDEYSKNLSRCPNTDYEWTPRSVIALPCLRRCGGDWGRCHDCPTLQRHCVFKKNQSRNTINYQLR